MEIFKNHLKFIDTITTKLLTLVLFVTVIPLMVVANFSTSIINQITLDSSKSELTFNNLLSVNKYKQELESLKLITSQATRGFIDRSYDRYIKDQNQEALLKELLTFKNNSDIDFCFLLDSHNKIAIDPTKSGKKQDYSVQKLVEEAFKTGKIITSTEVMSDVDYISNLKNSDVLGKKINKSGIYHVVAAPILGQGDQVRAILLIGKSLTNREIPKFIRTTTGATLTIYQFLDKEMGLITTNLEMSDKAKNAVIIIDKELLGHVKKNDHFLIRTEQVNGFELGQNVPIKNFLGNIIGIMYVGIPENKFTEPGSNNIKLISVISVISLIVSVLIAALFARTITTPLLKLVIAAKSIAGGYFHQRMPIKGNDEIAQLSSTFNKMADNLHKQEQLRDNFVATLTHDLKVPMLAENQTITYLLKETYGPITEEQKDVLELIRSTNSSSLEMVSTLLEVYRYDTGNANLLKTEFDIVKLVSDSIDQIKSLAEDKKITISLSSDKDRILITADEREIKRVLHNLISNAITNGIHRGQIHCGIELIEDSKAVYYPKTSMDDYTTLTKPVNLFNTVLISIRDDGIGITREDIQELFKRFSFNKGRKPSGTGLGLYYSHQVITKHNGGIWAESAEGKGSVFRFILPIKE